MCKAPRVPPERSATADSERLAVAVDATPLLGRPTGVGAFCAGALSGLVERQDLAISAFAISWRRRRGIANLVPTGVAVRQRAMPARPLLASWSRFNRPAVEWFIGRHDVVHGSNFVVPPTRWAARVITVHDLAVMLFPELCDPPTLAFPDLIRRAVADGAWVHTPSQFVADQAVAELGIDSERVRAVHLGIPALPASTGAEDLGFQLPEGCGRYVLAIGTIEPRKDYPLLVSAFASATADCPDVALVVVGGDGWGTRQFEEACAQSPARARIVRSGYIEDAQLAATLRQAAMLAYPSVYEGFGFPPLQAMAEGVPVVATEAGAVPEVVGDGALLVDPGDTDGLAAAIGWVLQGGSSVDELVARGRRRSRQFSWEACAAGLDAIYREAVSARPVDGHRPSSGAPS